MQTIQGLKELYELFKLALNQDQEYLDPKNDPGKHPENIVLFEYTLNFDKFYVRGDTKKVAMEKFCNLYEQKIASGNKISNLFDNDILQVSGQSLRLPGQESAVGLYFVKKLS